MNKSTFKFLPNFLQLLLFIGLYICYTTGILVWQVRGVSPMFLLPLLISFAMYKDEIPAALTGLALGIFVDGVSAFGGIFHTVFFFAVGLCTTLLVRYYLNNNIRSAILLSLVGALLYYLFRWLFRHAFTDTMAGSTVYLLQYALPGVLYTGIYIFPFYYLERALNRYKLK